MKPWKKRDISGELYAWEVLVGKKLKPLKHGVTEETEERKIANNAEIAKESKLIECHCRRHWSFTPLLPPFLCVSKVFGLFGLCDKLPGLNLACSLYLHKDAIVSRLREAIREGYFC